MPSIDLGYLDQSMKADGWAFDGLSLTSTAGANTHPHADLTAAADPRGNLLRVDGTLLRNSSPSTHAALQTYLDARSLYPRVKRPLPDIYADLLALTAAKQTAIWTNLAPLLPAYTGKSAAAIWCLYSMAVDLALAATPLAAVKRRATAMYVADNPAFLVRPPWDSTLNIPGDQ